MLNLISQLAPGGTRTTAPASRQVEAPVEPSPLLQTEVLLTIIIVALAGVIWVAYSIRKSRSSRN